MPFEKSGADRTPSWNIYRRSTHEHMAKGRGMALSPQTVSLRRLKQQFMGVLLGRTYYLSFQTSSTVIALPLDRHRRIQVPSTGAMSTLQPDVLADTLVNSEGQPINGASDIHMIGDLLLVANRRVKAPYPSWTGEAEDTIAVFEPKGATLIPRGHIKTGCWKPRRMIRVEGTGQKEYLAVSCNGQYAQGGGIVLVDMTSEPYRIVGRWDSGRMTASGLVGLASDFT